MHDLPCPVNPGQGIGVPNRWRTRAKQPLRRGLLWSGVSRAPSGAPSPSGGTPIVARPATRIGVRGPDDLDGDRP
jgi:hypothetical protein